MPRVPLSDGPQARAAPLPGPFQGTPDVSSATRALAGGLGAVGEAADRIAQREDQDVAWRTQAKINNDWVTFEAKARKEAQGTNAKGYAEATKQWWDKAAEDYGGALTPSQRQIIGKHLTIARGQAFEGALKYENTELDRSRLEALDGALGAEINRGIAGGPRAAAASSEILSGMLRDYGASAGKPKEWVDAKILERTTALHANVISTLMQQDPKAAEAYFTANKGQIDATRHDEISKQLNATAAVADGDSKADALWRAAGAGTPGNPIEIDKLEAAAREAFPNDPVRAKHAIDGIRQRTQAFEHAEAQRAAGRTNSVYKMIDSGTPMSRVKMSPEWQALGGKEQDGILYQQEQRAAARESRAAAAEGRAAAAESRDYTRMQRDQHLLLIRNYDTYMRLQDPDTLAAMPREQVIATRSAFGIEGSQHLLQKWDALQKPGAVGDAKIDADQFNAYAQQMGLRPLEKNQSEDQKLLLVQTRDNVERALAQEEIVKKRKLTRPEKDVIMQREVARVVTIDNPYWFNSQKPFITLTPEEKQRIVIEPATKERAARLMDYMLQRASTDEQRQRLQPNDANLRAFVLENPELLSPLSKPAAPTRKAGGNVE